MFMCGERRNVIWQKKITVGHGCLFAFPFSTTSFFNFFGATASAFFSLAPKNDMSLIDDAAEVSDGSEHEQDAPDVESDGDEESKFMHLYNMNDEDTDKELQRMASDVDSVITMHAVKNAATEEEELETDTACMPIAWTETDQELAQVQKAHPLVESLEQQRQQDPFLSFLPLSAAHWDTNPEYLRTIGLPLDFFAPTLELKRDVNPSDFVVVWPPMAHSPTNPKTVLNADKGDQYNGLLYWKPKKKLRLFRWQAETEVFSLPSGGDFTVLKPTNVKVFIVTAAHKVYGKFFANPKSEKMRRMLLTQPNFTSTLALPFVLNQRNNARAYLTFTTDGLPDGLQKQLKSSLDDPAVHAVDDVFNAPATLTKRTREAAKALDELEEAPPKVAGAKAPAKKEAGVKSPAKKGTGVKASAKKEAVPKEAPPAKRAKKHKLKVGSPEQEEPGQDELAAFLSDDVLFDAPAPPPEPEAKVVETVKEKVVEKPVFSMPFDPAMPISDAKNADSLQNWASFAQAFEEKFRLSTDMRDAVKSGMSKMMRILSDAPQNAPSAKVVKYGREIQGVMAFVLDVVLPAMAAHQKSVEHTKN